jgi:hypothetical protein
VIRLETVEKRAQILMLVLGAGLLAACGAGHGDRPRRPAGSAVWIDARMAGLAPSSARALRSAGVEEAFVAAGEIVADGQGTLSLDPWTDDLAQAAPAHTPVTLTLVGAWPPPGGTEDFAPDRAAESLAGGLAGLRTAAEGAELLPVGVHLHLDPPRGASSGGEGAGLEALAALVGELRERLPSDLFLSASLARDWIGAPGWEELARACDFIVPFLYGEPPGAPDRPEAWDPEQVAGEIARLDDLGADFLVGVRSIGTASRLGSAGDVLDVTTRASLPAMARNPDLRRALGDAFGGVGRLVYSFQAQRRTRVAGWELAPGETVRIVRTAPSLLWDLRRRLEQASHGHLLGLLVQRLPSPGEELSPSADALAAVFEESAPEPALHPGLVVQSRSGSTVVLGVTIENRSSLSTDLALSDGNYLSVEAGGAYVEQVDPGTFNRYTLWRDGREVRPGVGWREPDEVRLYVPMLVGGETVGGARVTLRERTEESGAAFVSGRFYLPDGRELRLEPTGGPVVELPGQGGASAQGQ